MRKFEISLIIAFLVAIILRLFFVPGGGILTVLSLSILSSLYFYLSIPFFNRLKIKDCFTKGLTNTIKREKLVLSLVVGVVLSITVISLLFRLMFWPGQTIFAFSAIISSIVILVVIFTRLDFKDSFFKDILIRTVFAFFVNVILLFVSTEIIIKIQYRNYPKYITAYEKVLENPNDTNLIRELEHERNVIYYGNNDYNEFHNYEPIEFYENGSVKVSKSTDSVFTFFYHNSRPSEIGRISNGYKTGVWHEYYQDGKIKWIGNYFENRREIVLRDTSIKVIVLNDSQSFINSDSESFPRPPQKPFIIKKSRPEWPLVFFRPFSPPGGTF